MASRSGRGLFTSVHRTKFRRSGLARLGRRWSFAQKMARSVYAAFAGVIDQLSLARIFQGFAGATNLQAPGGPFSTVHLLFQSTGGTVGDGIALYNFFRGLPLDLHIYNVGSVQSVAAIAYLGAKHRHTSAHGTFMIHKTSFPAQAGLNAGGRKALTDAATAEDRRIEAIIKERAKIPEGRLVLDAMGQVTFNAQEAVDFGIADDIREFEVPPGNQVFNI